MSSYGPHLDSLLLHMVTLGASDLYLTVESPPVYRVDGVGRAGRHKATTADLEGLANATMEAMAVGLPVITTATCGQTELVEDGVNGRLVPVADAAALAVAMLEVIEDLDGARRLGARARATIEERFNPVTESARLAEILRDTAVGARERNAIA